MEILESSRLAGTNVMMELGIRLLIFDIGYWKLGINY
jgi:hypothetical protein